MSANDSKFECGCPACTCGVVDTGGMSPWGAPIMDLCRTCYGSGRVLVKEFFDNIRKTNPIYKEHMSQESKTQEHDGLFYTSTTPTKPGVYRLIIFGHEPTVVELHRDRDNSGVLWYGPDRKTSVRDGDGWWCPLIPRQVMESEITVAYKEGFNDCMKVVTSDWYVAYDQSRSKRVVDERELADGEPGGAK